MSFDMNPEDDDPHGECRQEIKQLQSQVASLLSSCKSIVQLANVAHAYWDADEDHKVGKILLAMAGHLKGYLPETEALHASITKAEAAR